MSASGSTPHLHLSQYTDTDHPSYVSDYTQDMGRIDTGFNLAQTNALTALNRVAALEQSVGSAGAVGQTVMFEKSAAVDSSISVGNPFTLGFNDPVSMATRNAEPADVPWTWQPNGDTVSLRFIDRGVYRVTVEAYASYPPSLNISSAYINLWERIAPFVYYAQTQNGPRLYCAVGSFVIPYDGVGSDVGFSKDLRFLTRFNDQIVSSAQVMCVLNVDVEQLATDYLDQQPEPRL